MSKTVPFQAIQFSTSPHFSSSWPIDRTLSDATTLGHSGPGSIPQNSSITEASPWDCLVSYQDTRWGGVLPFYSKAVSVFYTPLPIGQPVYDHEIQLGLEIIQDKLLVVHEKKDQYSLSDTFHWTLIFSKNFLFSTIILVYFLYFFLFQVLWLEFSTSCSHPEMLNMPVQ